MARIHNRMPVILQDSQINSWLDLTTSDPQKLSQLLKSPPEDFLQYHPVSKELSSARTDEPACAERVELDCSKRGRYGELRSRPFLDELGDHRGDHLESS